VHCREVRAHCSIVLRTGNVSELLSWSLEGSNIARNSSLDNLSSRRLSGISGCLIPRLHDQTGSTSCYMLAGRASSMFARCLLDVFSTFARCLLDVCLMIVSCRLCFMHASYLLDVCLMFARSCKRVIRQSVNSALRLLIFVVTVCLLRDAAWNYVIRPFDTNISLQLYWIYKVSQKVTPFRYLKLTSIVIRIIFCIFCLQTSKSKWSRCSSADVS